MKTGMQVSLADLVFLSDGFFHGEPSLVLFHEGEVVLTIAVPTRTEYLNVVKGSPGLIDLQGEVGALLVYDGMLGIGYALVIEMGDDLVPDEFHRHDVPFVRLELVGAFAVTHGKPRPAVVLGGLDEEVVAPDMQNGVVVTGSPRHQTDVPRLRRNETRSG